MLHLKIFLIVLNICNIISLQNPPDRYMDVDNPFRDDIEVATEKDHHIITAVTARWNGYVDYYKGIYYKKYLYCHWKNHGYGFYPVNDSTVRIPGYLKLQNINDTNLKDLQSHGCAYSSLNILLDYRRSVSEALVSLTIRLTNTFEEDTSFQFGICSSFEDNYKEQCPQDALRILDTYNITNNSFLVYTFRFTEYSYYVQSDNFQNPTDYYFKSTDHLRFFIICELQLHINSYIVSVDLFRYVLSLAGHAHNYCTNKGCLDGYDCSMEWSSDNNGKSPKYYACKLHYHGYVISECSLFGCIPGSFCSPDTVCIECDYQCKTCFDKTYMNCKSCYSIAIYPYWMYDNQFDKGTQCIFEFYPINKAESYNIDIPIPLSYRITLEFWMFIHDPTYLTNKDLRLSLSSFIIKDFLTFSFHRAEDDFNSTKLIITPFEYFFPFKKDYTTIEDFYGTYKKLFPSLQYLQVDFLNVTSKWVYVKAGLSYTHNKMFINEEEMDLDYIPIYDKDENTKYNAMMRKFYRRYDKTYLRIQGFEYINTDVYIRNFNLYSDYMFNRINSPNYFNMHEITNSLVYPQLMLSIPFTNITVDPTKMFVKFQMYDYSNQYTDVSKNPDQVLISEVKMKLIRDYLAPSKNFFRLNFLHFKNFEYINTDLFAQTLAIECSDEGQVYCFEDLQPYICRGGYDLLVNYENNTESNCIKNCTQIDSEGNVHKYMRLPNIKKKSG